MFRSDLCSRKKLRDGKEEEAEEEVSLNEAGLRTLQSQILLFFFRAEFFLDGFQFSFQ